MLINTTPKTH